VAGGTSAAEGCPHGSLAEHRAGADAICVDHVSYRYDSAGGQSQRPALRDVTLHIERGCSLGIIGPNGAGKTTLLKIMLGLLEGYSGSVQVMSMSPPAACRLGGIIGYVPQRHSSEWRVPVTVRQVVRMGLVGKTGLFRRHSRDDRAYVEHLLERVGIDRLADRPIGDLSGGQQQRCFMARALAAKPKILILDEPLVGIDEAGQQQFAELSHDLHRSLDLTLVIVSHDIRAIATGCTRVACLNQTIHYHDSPAGLTEEVLREVFQHEISWALRRKEGERVDRGDKVTG
jgi:zinc transport system ATP-binding protein